MQGPTVLADAGCLDIFSLATQMRGTRLVGKGVSATGKCTGVKHSGKKTWGACGGGGGGGFLAHICQQGIMEARFFTNSHINLNGILCLTFCYHA